MKVLLCSPYLQTSEVISGGINIWAYNLLSYSSSIESSVKIFPVSFDRRNHISDSTKLLRRMVLGLKEHFSAIKETIKEMDKQHFDVVHICTSASLSLIKDIVLLKVAQNRGIKSVIHFHFGRIPDLMATNNWEWKLIKKCLSLATIAVTMDMKSYSALQNSGFKNVFYCPNPLSSAVIKQIEAEEGKYDRISKRLLYVGHVYPSKGVYELVKACKDLDNIELHIVGRAEPNIKKELEDIAQSKNNGQWIKFHGEIPHDEVLREMMKASIFVLPSYTEGFPNVILESMACACAIIATPVGAVPEMLDVENHTYCGKLVETKNIEQLKNAIQYYLININEALAMGLRAQKRVKEKYSINFVWKQMVHIWDQTVRIKI